MENLAFLLVLILFVLFIIGLFSPSTSLFWLKQERTRKKSSLIYGGGFFIIALIASNIWAKDSKNTAQNKTEETATTTPQTPKHQTTIGDPLNTQYFQVTILKAGIRDFVNTGNEFTDLKAEPGNRFLLIKVTFKNIDNESRMLEDGKVFIDYNGKRYNFDKSEPVMAEGWGLFLDQINPLVSKTTNLVYKIPTEITGPAYYNPGRADDNQLIFLGNL